ncbi:MAG: putative aminotransferase, StrS family [Acidobacteriaceae bacterium]|nr:putative aminotransferase, StrS family [Acidobacteriaceae bacterium]
METLLPANPKLGYLAHKKEIDAAIQQVLESGLYILGENVSQFEEQFASFIGASSCVGVGNGTDALIIALRACGIGPGDGVITVSHTAVATVAAIDVVGAVPILVDVDPAMFTMDLDKLEQTLKSYKNCKIKAIIPVHIYGQPLDMESILEIAGRYDLMVIEDCAQSHGAEFRNRRVGSFGHIGAFSFYPTKNLGALGDGGAIVTSDPQIAERARMLRQYGWKRRYISDSPGSNTRLDELQAAILRVKLRYLNPENARRRALAAIYSHELESVELQVPREATDSVHIYHQYVVRTTRRDDLKARLSSNSIETAILYPVAVHDQAGYKSRVVVGSGGLEETERICNEILSLPIYPELKDEQIGKVIDVIRTW